MENENVRLRYERAVESFIEKVRDDRNIIAVIVAGSYSYDAVWDKSDIDTTVIIRDQDIDVKSFCIDEDDIILNVDLIQRSDFKRRLEKNTGGSAGHSFLAKGTMIYTTDEDLRTYFEEYKRIGRNDMERSLFYMAGELVSCMNKLRKWVIVKNDLTYARYYAVKASEAIARMEVCRNLEIPTREVVAQAAALNPALTAKFYERPLAGPMSREDLLALAEETDAFLMDNITPVFDTAMLCLGDGEPKTVTQISRYFKSGSHFIINIFEYLNEKGMIEKLTQTIRLTPKSKPAVEEAAFQIIEEK